MARNVDPAPSVHESGDIRVDRNCKRLAVDMTHYHHRLYCGPGRIAIWRIRECERNFKDVK